MEENAKKNLNGKKKCSDRPGAALGESPDGSQIMLNDSIMSFVRRRQRELGKKKVSTFQHSLRSIHNAHQSCIALVADSIELDILSVVHFIIFHIADPRLA